MGKKSNSKASGLVHRRSFSGVRLDAALESELRQAEALGFLLGWEHDSSELTVSRNWIDGTDYRQIFTKFEAQDRTLYSQQLFNGTLEHLEDLGHGAVHPGNVLHVGNSPVFLDVVANAARLGGTGGGLAPTYAIWLWAPRIPEGWEVGDWDRINLLRMVVLLAQGAASWDTAPTIAEAVELCREWAEGFRRTLPAGADEAASLSRVLELLKRLESEPKNNNGFATVAQVLASSLDRQGDRMLRPADEDKIRADWAAANLSDELFALELHRRGFQRQSALKLQAQAFLNAGVYPGTRCVKRSALCNAERLYSAYGVAEAGIEVQSLLKELDLFDEREVQKAWSKLVDDYVEKHCRRGYSSKHFAKMMAIIDINKLKLSRGAAENQLRRYLEQEKKLRELRGFLRIG